MVRIQRRRLRSGKSPVAGIVQEEGRTTHETGIGSSPRQFAALGIRARACFGCCVGFWLQSSSTRQNNCKGRSEVPVRMEDATSERGRVDVIHPLLGQMPRSISEPGTVKAFDYADLYAKVSGYLQVQNVDIGDAVTKNQLLAKLFAPELVQAVEQSKAELAQANAQLNLAVASLTRAKADVTAADSRLNEKQIDLRRETAYREFRQIEYERIRDLYSLRAIEEKMVDQNVKNRDAALQAENAAKADVQSAQSDLAAKKAKVAEADAELANARAKIEMTKATLAKAEVYVNYLEMRSPYKGVIALRSFHVGDFVTPPVPAGNASPF